MAIHKLNQHIWINPDHITQIVLWNDPADDNLEKAKVYFVGQSVPLALAAPDTQRLLTLLK
jgi:hypothetical protein